MTKQGNLGWHYYRGQFHFKGNNGDKTSKAKKYFLNLHESEDNVREETNENEIAPSFNNYYNHHFFSVPFENYAKLKALFAGVKSNVCINLKVHYPGLLIGTGYNHDTGFIGEAKLGFFFDHTTGLPVIPGSSVKGRLRSAFPNWAEENKKERRTYIFKNLQWLMSNDKQLIDAYGEEIVDRLEYELFGTKPEVESSNTKSIYNRDIFYDAFIEGSDFQVPNGSGQPVQLYKDGSFLGDDYITPHKHPTNPKLDPFVNPTPLRLLKLLPGVKLSFPMKLEDTTINGITFSKNLKKQLFTQILTDLGIGAKTSVGYSALTL